MTEKIMSQYETLRSSGFNMYDYCCVISEAKWLNLKELSDLSFEQYKEVLLNSSKYMKQFNIVQNKI